MPLVIIRDWICTWIKLISVQFILCFEQTNPLKFSYRISQQLTKISISYNLGHILAPEARIVLLYGNSIKTNQAQ